VEQPSESSSDPNSEQPAPRPARHPPSRTVWLALGALGVVYGDIGTSPLYALRECFSVENGIPATPENILGVLSLILWSLIIVISLKYVAFVLRADNRGEGGVLALMTLVAPSRAKPTRTRRFLVAIGLFGAALLYGDGIITPAISVLSAVEGLSVATPLFQPFVIPIAIVVLTGLFVVQRHGTGTVGAVFGPIMVVWFSCLAAMGMRWVLLAPEVIEAVNPWHSADFLARNSGAGFTVLGAVFLVVTGGEALYADMGHFGRRPIRLAWFGVTLPALVLNYYGQGALLLLEPEDAVNPFYHLAPSWALFPLVVLSTAATVIASQAVISGAFSLTRQALQLGLIPRMEIEHHSASEIGQVFVPWVNAALLVATIALVIGFGSSSALAGAYGVAVSTTMVLTTVLAYVCARQRWGWSALAAGALALFFLVIDVSFLGANMMKIDEGGWVPLLVGLMIYVVMTTWKRGRRILREHTHATELPLDMFLADIETRKPLRVAGTAVYMTSSPTGVPRTLGHNLKHNKVIHEKVILLTVESEDVPHTTRDERLTIEALGQGFTRIIAHYGFMDTPNVPAILVQAGQQGVEYKPLDTTFFLGRETLVFGENDKMARWRKRLFSFLSRNAESATSHYYIPVNRVVELGAQVEL